MSTPTFRWRTALVIGIGFCSHYIIWRIYNVLVPPLLADLGLSAMVIGFIMAWDNIVDLLTQPWIGARSDRVPGRFGRRKP